MCISEDFQSLLDDSQQSDESCTIRARFSQRVAEFKEHLHTHGELRITNTLRNESSELEHGIRNRANNKESAGVCGSHACGSGGYRGTERHAGRDLCDQNADCDRQTHGSRPTGPRKPGKALAFTLSDHRVETLRLCQRPESRILSLDHGSGPFRDFDNIHNGHLTVTVEVQRRPPVAGQGSREGTERRLQGHAAASANGRAMKRLHAMRLARSEAIIRCTLVLLGAITHATMTARNSNQSHDSTDREKGQQPHNAQLEHRSADRDRQP